VRLRILERSSRFGTPGKCGKPPWLSIIHDSLRDLVGTGRWESRLEGVEAAMAEALWFEDLKVGMTFQSGPIEVEEARLKSFAAEFDPQPFHLDEAAGRASPFGGLVASGWHTTAMTMKLLVGGGLPIAGGLIGLGVDALRWPAPVRAGDILRVAGEVTEVRLSRSGAPRGTAQMHIRTINQDGAIVQEMTTRILVPCRDAGDQRPKVTAP
jgi:acyl dehydratase